MKKIFIMLSSVALLIGAVSCNKETTSNNQGKGNLTVSYGFEGVDDGTRYTASTNKPATTWAGNIKSLTLFLAESGIVKAALNIPAQSDQDNVNKTFTFQNVPAGTYTGYLIANYDQTNISSSFSASSTGMNVSTMLMNLVAQTTWPADAETETASTAYNVPAEIFLASVPIEVIANQENNRTGTPFMLTRAISMMRVRINKNFTSNVVNNLGQTVVVDNSTVDFSAATSALRVRKMGTALNYAGTVTPTTALGTNLIYSAGYNTTPAPPAGYEDPDSPLYDAAEGLSAWKDMFILPGGGTGNSANKFDIVVSGMAPIGYIPLGATTGIEAATLVHWNGTVEAVVGANNIIELNCELKTQGTTVVPPPTDTGTLIIAVNLVPWGDIQSVTLIM